MFRKDIGKEFYKQMNTWFIEHPEIKHQWKKNELKIHYPNDANKFLTFQFDSKKIIIQNESTKKVFFRKLFTNIEIQVIKIRSFWINELLKKEETQITKPTLKKNQIAVMFCNRKYGQVLTTEKKVFTGWGNVYQIFDNEKEVKKFIDIESKDKEIEINLFNSKYEKIELNITTSNSIVIKAKLRLYSTENGGRRSGIKTGYRPNHIFEYKEGGTDFKAGYMGKISFDENHIIEPNESKIVKVEFESGQDIDNYIQIGRTWWIHEGNRKIGEAKITEITTE